MMAFLFLYIGHHRKGKDLGHEPQKRKEKVKRSSLRDRTFFFFFSVAADRHFSSTDVFLSFVMMAGLWPQASLGHQRIMKENVHRGRD